MPIRFDASRWERVRENYARWWAGELKRPLVQVTLHGVDPGRPKPVLPMSGFTANYGLAVPPETVVDVWDHHLASQEYLGDAFPGIWPNFGPGVGAAFLGAVLEARWESVWFYPRHTADIAGLRLAFDAENVWLRRVKDLCRAAVERWQGQVLVGMTDIGGNLDLLSTFRPGEQLILDLYDHPGEVKRVTWEAHEAWWRIFDDINAVLQPVNPGYSAWTPIYSAEPYYMLQCDFCYMIGPDMFDEFVKPELAASCRRLGNAFYHLDGPGELPHLDSLLTIPELKGVQWVPGAGAKPCEQWPEVYRKIHEAGKLIQLWGGASTLDTLVSQIGTAEGIVIMTGMPADRRSEAEAFLAKYGAL
jgi:5-methyltetrahydrofolate--homocysteine methyltransferase